MIVVHLAHKQSMTSIPDEPQQPTRELLSIPIHSLILAAHNAHGLGHGDFAQYRIYCTHRLARLRCHKSVKKDLSYSATGYKASIDRPPVRGGRHAFHPKSIVEDTNTLLSHPNFTLVHLYAAERAWSFAMELKLVHDQRKAGNGQGTSLKQSASPASVRRHSKQRLKKACKHVTQLLRCAHEACDEKTRAECLAYAGWIWGNYYFEVGQWELACKNLSQALLICKAMALDTAFLGESSSITVDLEGRDLFTSRANTVIQPLLRFAQYELQQEKKIPSLSISHLIQSFQQELIQQDQVILNTFLLKRIHGLQSVTSKAPSQKDVEEEDGMDINHINFRGLKIKVDNKSLRMMLWKLKDRKKDLESVERGSGDEDAIYVDLLSCYDDAIALVSDDLKSLAQMASGPSVNAKKSEATGTLGYIKYERLKVLMMHTEHMIEDLVTEYEGNPTLDPDHESKHLEEISHLYDILLQDAKAVINVPGGHSLDIGGMNVEDEFILQGKANLLRIRAFRCYYIGCLYATPTLGQFGKAMGLYNLASKLAAQAAEEIAACSDMEKADSYIQALVDLELDLSKAKCRAKVEAILSHHGGGGGGSSVDFLSVFRRLDDYQNCISSFVPGNALPPLEPIICKPSFFDVAGTYASEYPFDDLQQQIDASKPPTSTRGILGWFRSS